MNLKNDRGIHLAHPFADCTLCGDADDGGIDVSHQPAITGTNEKVDCTQCLQIIIACVKYNEAN